MSNNNNLKKYTHKINLYQSVLKSTKNKSDCIEKMIKLYSYAKMISLKISKEYQNPNSFTPISDAILKCERYLPKDEYISNVKPNYPFVNSEAVNNFDENVILLHDIVNRTRKYLHRYSDSKTPFYQFDLTNYCGTACNYTIKICKQKKIKAIKIKINPGFTDKFKLYNGFGFHYFVIVELNGIRYLVDPTYSQFFLLKRNILERIGIMNLMGCDPGIFMNMNPDRKKVSDIILQDGWIELTDENLKHYLDGFAISFRNGLYYEKTNDFSFNTNYTADDYRNFLNGNDSQLNHEGKIVLGYQEIPLENHKMKFY